MAGKLTERDDEPRKAVYPTSQPGPTPDDVLDAEPALTERECEALLIASHTVEPVADTGTALFAVVARIKAQARREGAADALDKASEALGKESVGFRDWWRKPGGGPEDGAALDTVKKACDWLAARAAALRGEV